MIFLLFGNDNFVYLQYLLYLKRLRLIKMRQFFFFFGKKKKKIIIKLYECSRWNLFYVSIKLNLKSSFFVSYPSEVTNLRTIKLSNNILFKEKYKKTFVLINKNIINLWNYCPFDMFFRHHSFIIILVKVLIVPKYL